MQVSTIAKSNRCEEKRKKEIWSKKSFAKEEEEEETKVEGWLGRLLEGRKVCCFCLSRVTDLRAISTAGKQAKYG
jgi:hypothetical protein